MRISDWSSDVCSSDLRADDLSLARSRSQIFHKTRSREHKHDNDQKPYEPHHDHHQSATTAHHLHAVGRHRFSPLCLSPVMRRETPSGDNKAGAIRGRFDSYALPALEE